MPVVSRLFYYPIKGCRRVEVESAVLDEVGFPGDREFIVVDSAGLQLTQRENPRLALIDPASVSVISQPSDGPEVPVVVFDWTGTGIDQGDEVAAELSDQLDQSVRLLHFGADQKRRAHIGSGLTRYSDAQTLLLVSTTSLADLNSRLEHEIGIERFRPSVVIDGISEPWVEDDFTAAALGPVGVEFVEWCGRCVVVTVDQDTGVKGREPLRTLSTFRQKRKPMEGNSIVFGHYAAVTTGGRLSVGDEVRLR